VAVNGRQFRLPAEWSARLRRNGSDRERAGASPGEPLTFCVRPERLRVGAESNRFSASVESAEFLGESTRVRLDWEGRTVTLRTDDPPEVGAVVDVGFAPDDVHVLPGAEASRRRDESDG
jgi:thiamine transport system ATP-binding protein